MKPARQSIPLERIATSDATTQCRVRLCPHTIDDYTEYLTNGTKLPPPDVFGPDEDGIYFVGDGFHRLAAARAAGVTEPECAVRPGGRQEALEHALQANERHGLRRTAADRRLACERALTNDRLRCMSDRQLANVCRVDRRMVSKVRAQLEQEHPGMAAETRVGADGRERTAQPASRAMRREVSLWDQAAESLGNHGVLQDMDIEPTAETGRGENPAWVGLHLRPCPEEIRSEVGYESVPTWGELLADREVPTTVEYLDAEGTEWYFYAQRALAIEAIQSLPPPLEIFRKRPISPRQAEKGQAQQEQQREIEHRRQWLGRLRAACTAETAPGFVQFGHALNQRPEDQGYFPLILHTLTFAISQAHESGLEWLLREYAPEIEANIESSIRPDLYPADKLILVGRALASDRQRIAMLLLVLVATDLRRSGRSGHIVQSAMKHFGVPWRHADAEDS